MSESNMTTMSDSSEGNSSEPYGANLSEPYVGNFSESYVGNSSGPSAQLVLSCGVELTESQWDTEELVRWWLIGGLCSLVALLGLLGNMISIIVLQSKTMASIFNHLLSCLCGADSLFLLSSLLVHPFHLNMGSHNTTQIVFPIIEGSCHFSMTLSIFLIVSITVERWQAVCFPYQYQLKLAQRSNCCHLMWHLLPVFILAALCNITRFLSLSPLGIPLQQIPQYLKFLLGFQIFHPLTTTGLAPLLILSILNYQIHRQMAQSAQYFPRESLRTREFVLARTLTVLVLVFLCLNFPRLVITLLEVTKMKTVEACHVAGLEYNVSLTTIISDYTARLLIILNSSINFIIYCLVGADFRCQLKRTLTSLKNRFCSCIKLNSIQTDRVQDLEVTAITDLPSTLRQGSPTTVSVLVEPQKTTETHL